MSEYDFSAPTTFQDAWGSDGSSSDEDEVTDQAFFGTRTSFILPGKNPAGPTALAKALSSGNSKPGSPFFERTTAVQNAGNTPAPVSAKKSRNRSSSSLQTLPEVNEAAADAAPTVVVADDDISRAAASSIPIWNPADHDEDKPEKPEARKPDATHDNTDIPERVAAKQDETASAETHIDTATVPTASGEVDVETAVASETKSDTSNAAELVESVASESSSSDSSASDTVEHSRSKVEAADDAKPAVHFDEATIAKTEQEVPKEAKKKLSSSTASTPKRKSVPGYLRGTAASASKRRSAERRNDKAERPAAKMSRLTRSGARGLSMSTKKKSRSDVRAKAREDAIRAASARKKKKAVSNAAPMRKARKLTEPIEFNFSTSRRRTKSVKPAAPENSTQAVSVVAGVSDPFSLGRAAAVPTTKYDAKTLTRPKAFNLATASRARKRAVTKETAEPQVFKSTKELVDAFQNKTPARFHSRSRLEDQPELPQEFHPSLTVPVAPNITLAKTTIPSSIAAAKGASDTSPFVPLVNRVSSFHSKTPDRFKSEARLKTEGAAVDQTTAVTKGFNPQLTCAVSPAFQSDLRAIRKPMPKSTAELQEEYIQKHAWTAMPVNKAALHSTGDMGVPRIAKKACTEPKEFKLSHTNRTTNTVASDDAVAPSSFKARALPKRMLQEAQFSTMPSCKPLTETASPMLRTKMRAALSTKPRPAPSGELECDHDFRAQPAPSHIFTQVQVPPRPAAAGVTQPEEFQLESTRRHEMYQQQLRERIQAEEAAAIVAAEFKV